jgi:stage V sporulation protein S
MAPKEDGKSKGKGKGKGKGSGKGEKPEKKTAAPAPAPATDSDIPSFKVARSSDPKTVAGAISNAARRGDKEVQMTACGAASVNQAVKAIAIARGRYLAEDNFEIDVTADKEEGREFRHLVSLHVKFVEGRSRSPMSDATSLKVSGKSMPAKVAGALASALRQDQCCKVAVVGADSLLNAVLAIVRAKSYIETDNLDLQFWPDFVHLQVDGEQRTGVILNVLPVKVA